ncbi:MAG: permease [Alkalispirochaeta sp.]
MSISKRTRNYIYAGVFAAFIAVSWFLHFEPGIEMGRNFSLFAKDMVLILPPAFILIGLFDVWAKRETIERHFGETADARGYIWSILLAATTVGGTFVAFPVANALYHKGARYSMIMTYVTAASLVMIPMSIMEAAILGPLFTALRIVVSLPLVIIGSILIEKILLRRGYEMPETTG